MLTQDEERMLREAEFSLQWLLGRTHIGTSDFKVAKEFYWRLHHYNHGRKYSRELRKAYVKRALQIHHDNQGLYDFVMGPH